MTEDDLHSPPDRQDRPDQRESQHRLDHHDRSRGADAGLRPHEVRTALLALLAEVGAVTATEAAARLGYSSGLCSFHLRQLARHGYIEEAPAAGAVYVPGV